MSEPRSEPPRGAERRPALVVAGAAALVLWLVLRVRPASVWLRALSPDGVLELNTASFLDALGGLVLLAALALLAAGLSRPLRTALAAGWSAPPPAVPAPSRWLAPAAALFAFALRIAVATAADIGLGDDGARVVWLERWLKDPKPVWSGLWLPAHLYLHAFVNSVVRDPVWAGVLLSAAAAGGTVWILTRSFEAVWGRGAGLVAAIAAAVLPVSIAYGSNPDVNPVFAFFMVAAVAAVDRGARTGKARWLVLAWACLATATWMRFDSVLLVPALAALLLPRRRTAGLFAIAGGLPLVLWTVADSVITHRTGRVVDTVLKDPTLAGSPTSVLFSYLGGVWQAVTLPVVVLGAMGMVRALSARAGRAWMLLPLVHAASLAGTTVVFHAGTQPRYFILAATVFAAYSGVAAAAILARSRPVGWGVLALAAVLLVVTPPMYPAPNHLWIRRDPQLRALVDELAQVGGGQDVVWVGDSAFYYACRKRPPVERYHAMPRADSDPRLTLEEMRGADHAVACVQQTQFALDRWARFLDLAGGEWEVDPVATRDDHRIYVLKRSKRTD